MDSAALDFLTPFLDGIDQWVELAPLLPFIIILELVLSADNAVALASITKGLGNIQQQRKALNISIIFSLILRIALILAASIIIKYSFIQIIASIYLLSLVINKFFWAHDESDIPDLKVNNQSSNMIRVIFLLAITDLAFSIDSVTAAVAISDQLLLVVTGAIVGIVALRLTADYFIRWLEIYTNLENAGYLAVGLVALKLLSEVIWEGIESYEYVFFILLLSVFFWGFSVKKESI